MKKGEERGGGGGGEEEEEKDTVQMSPGVKMCEPGKLPSSLTLSCFVLVPFFQSVEPVGYPRWFSWYFN
jgi:hypothetical protein